VKKKESIKDLNKSVLEGPSWLWSYGSWIYDYLCNQFLSPLMLWVRISIRARCTTLCDKNGQWLVTGRWFSPGTPVSSTNKTDHHYITEILLKVALNTIKTNKLTKNHKMLCFMLMKNWWKHQFFCKLKFFFMVFISLLLFYDNLTS
jgi:hypothetical protein